MATKFEEQVGNLICNMHRAFWGGEIQSPLLWDNIMLDECTHEKDQEVMMLASEVLRGKPQSDG